MGTYTNHLFPERRAAYDGRAQTGLTALRVCSVGKSSFRMPRLSSGCVLTVGRVLCTACAALFGKPLISSRSFKSTGNRKTLTLHDPYPTATHSQPGLAKCQHCPYVSRKDCLLTQAWWKPSSLTQIEMSPLLSSTHSSTSPFGNDPTKYRYHLLRECRVVEACA